MNVICIGANNLPVLEIIMKNYPDTIHNYKIYFMIEDKLNVDEEYLLRIIRENNIDNYEIIHSTTIQNAFRPLLKDTYFLDNYKGNIKTLGLWYLFKYKNCEKILTLEEDVILRDGFEKVFDSNKNVIYKYDYNIARDKSDCASKVWFDITGKDIVYYTPWAAPMLILRNSRVNEESTIIKIYEHEYFKNKLHTSKAWHVSYFDQTFLGMLYFDRNNYVDIRNITGLVIMGKNNIDYHTIIRLCNSKKFIHICCKSKLNICRELIQRGTLNG